MRVFARWAGLCCMLLVGCVTYVSDAHSAAAESAMAYQAVAIGKPLPTPSATVLEHALGGCKAESGSHNAIQGLIKQPLLVTTITAKGPGGIAISPNSSVTASTFPYAITYTVTVTNTGDLAVPSGVKVAILTGNYYALFFGAPVKEHYVALPKLAPGKSTTYTRKVTYTSGAFPFIRANADAYCQIVEDSSTSEVSHLFGLRTSQVDMGALAAAAVPLNTHIGDGVIAGDHVSIQFSLANYGLKDPTQSMIVRVISPLIGKNVDVEVSSAQLPKAGQAVTLVIADPMNSPVSYTVKTVTTSTSVPVRFSLNATHTMSEDSITNNTVQSYAHIVPAGTNVRALLSVAFLTADCQRFTGDNPVTITVYDGGTTSIPTAFLVQVLVDGKPSGLPISVAGLAVNTSTTVKTTAHIATIGFHMIGVRVDSSKVLAEYNESDNTSTLPKIYFNLD